MMRLKSDVACGFRCVEAPIMEGRSTLFRTYDPMKIVMHHTLGRLPEPETTHESC
jgi:hypothetical protein